MGDKKELYGIASPQENQKIKSIDLKQSAILTWFTLHQKPKYLHDLELGPEAFSGMRLLDIGAGPIPSALCFDNCDLYCLDPLYHRYLEIGFPIHCYGNVKFVHAFSEDIPIENNFFDAVISVNAIDHVDDLYKTSQEIKRVLREDGKFAMHVHYHPPAKTEPLEINDEMFEDVFSWCKGLSKVKVSQYKMGHTLDNERESYVLWKNFT